MALMLRSKLQFVAVFAAVVLSACVGAPSDLQYPAGKTLKITKDVWGTYQEYLATLSPRHTGVFVVALVDDIGVAGSYSYCPPEYDGCRGGDAISLAKQPCIEENLKCVLFARDQSIVVPYEVIGN